jgi:pSer/pThr/pTyr-binding forkhead associated (FHA) protein
MSSGRFPGPRLERPEPEAGTRYCLRFGGRELPLDRPETLIGRAEGCHVVVNEGLVSRRHARILVERGRAYIEDLGSANGTFVNQARLNGRALLFPGDHVFVGTCEIEVLREDADDRETAPALSPEDDEGRPTPSSGVAEFRKEVASEVVRSPSSRRRTSKHSTETLPPEEPTTQLEDFEYLGHLADKMFTMGRVDAARNILESHLNEILMGTRAGRRPSLKLLDAASRYAVKLAQETLDGRWVDAAVEMHLIMCRPFREETIQQLASLRAKAAIGSDELLTRYYERLRGNLASMSIAERILVERVACLVPELELKP